MLEVNDLNAFYGKSHILRGVTFNVKEGEIVSLLGRNGVGRSTTAKTIMAEVAPIGSIKFKGIEIAGFPARFACTVKISSKYIIVGSVCFVPISKGVVGVVGEITKS